MRMSRSILAAPVAALAIALLTWSAAAAEPAHADGAAAGPWTVVPSPSVGGGANYLDAVTAFSSTDAWAVGSYQSEVTAQFITLAEHWDGTRWRIAPTPNATGGYNELYAVDGASSSDIWAVGYSNRGAFGTERTLALHWNGAAWSIVRSPSLGTNASVLHALVVVAPDDAWAAGFGNSPNNQSGQALIEHWDGIRWRIAATPPTGGGFAEINGLAAVSADDVWAVGDAHGAPLAMHWDGVTWSIVPVGGGTQAGLTSVAGTASGDVWAAGFRGSRTLVEHWNGATWSMAASPNGPMDESAFEGVAAFGSSDAWAVGSTFDSLTGDARNLSARFAGSNWTGVATPNPSAEYDSLLGIGGLAGGDVWAVGTADGRTLVLRAIDA